jgi:hypothetical protein
MPDLNDLQKPLVAALALGAAATAGFVAGYMVGRDPETARRLARTIAGGLTRTQVALAETWENLGDLWADARAEAREEIEIERFAGETAEMTLIEPESPPTPGVAEEPVSAPKRKATKAGTKARAKARTGKQRASRRRGAASAAA